MSSTVPDRIAMRLGERMDLARTSIKAAALYVSTVRAELTREGVMGHVDPMGDAYAGIREALRYFENGSVAASHELALKLDAVLPEHPKETKP